MVGMLEMTEFMHHHVIHDVVRCDDDPSLESEIRLNFPFPLAYSYHLLTGSRSSCFLCTASRRAIASSIVSSAISSPFET